MTSSLWAGIALVLLTVAAIAGCGQKGPLYLPDQDEPPAEQRP